MGVAIGAVISKPAWIVLLVFTSLGLGLALPFLIFSLRPDLLRFLPKPGIWMLRLKEFFAFPMAATVIWLLWVFGQQVGVHGLGLAAIGVLLLFGAIWIFHRFSSWVKWFGWILVLLALILGWKSAAMVASSSGSVGQGTAWQEFSPEAVDKDLQAGKAVFVDFTAAWCLTCQANKALVLDTQEIQEFFREKGVALYLADWTNSDPIITKELEKFGRIGVPLYLAYGAGAKDPRVLPQVLTKELIKEAYSPVAR
jgi:thiol:disulfide interchange protein DsbD